jgi:hypothetical protein
MLDPFDHPPSQVPALETTSGDAPETLLAKPVADFVRPQFRIRDLMIATAVFAVYLVAAKAFGIWSLVIAYLGYLLANSIVRRTPRWRTTGAQLSLDLMAGAFLPIGCIVFDPFVFYNPILRVVGFATIASQIAMLCSWMFIAPLLGSRGFAFAGGFLLLGFCVAIVVAVLMLPFTLVGMLMLIGILGFIPFSTANTYRRHADTAVLHSAVKDGNYMVFGFCLAISIAILAALLSEFVPREWLKPPDLKPFGHMLDWEG